MNFEEVSATAEAKANDDDAMVRFEFIEGLVRCAFGKYIASKWVVVEERWAGGAGCGGAPGGGGGSCAQRVGTAPRAQTCP